MNQNLDTCIHDTNGKVSVKLFDNGLLVCTCALSISDKTWTISTWQTEEHSRHKGYGKQAINDLLSYCIKEHGEPSEIQYIWNGQNAYVGDWLKHNFDAVCLCPLAIRKTAPDDDYLSHMYHLDKDKVFSYFSIK